MTIFNTENSNESELIARQIYLRCAVPQRFHQRAAQSPAASEQRRTDQSPPFLAHKASSPNGSDKHGLWRHVKSGSSSAPAKTQLPGPRQVTKTALEGTRFRTSRLRSLYGLRLRDRSFSSRSTNYSGFVSFSETLSRADTSFVH